jgi:UDP-N-acetylmuramyl tripeptide synthase
MRLILLTTLLALPLSPVLAEVTVTNGKGGTATWTRDCIRGDSQATCTTNGHFTGAEGKTASQTRVRTTTPGSSVLDITSTGPQGNTRSKTRILTWGN